jgi:hypothetical protein
MIGSLLSGDSGGRSGSVGLWMLCGRYHMINVESSSLVIAFSIGVKSDVR